MLNFNQIKEIIKENFSQINITFNSSDKIEIFDPNNPQKKFLAEESSETISFFELKEETVEGFEEQQFSVDCQFIAEVEKENSLFELATTVI